MNDRRPARLAHLLLPALLLGPACQSSPPLAPVPPAPAAQQAQQARVTNEFTATAQVTAVDPAERRVTLQREDGTHFDLQVGEEVRNLDQVAVGDLLRVRFKETLAAAKLPAGTSIRSGEAAFAAGRAKPGAKPGAGVGMAVRLRVRIESIDRAQDIVVFSLASGELIARRLRTPEGRALVATLAVGDAVELEYEESLVLGIEKL